MSMISPDESDTSKALAPAEEYISLKESDDADQNPHSAEAEKAAPQPPVDNNSAPPLPDEVPPPLPNEAPPGTQSDDGWEPVWDENAQAFYFYNRITQTTQWENPRVPEAAQAGPPSVGNHDRTEAVDTPPARPAAGGYDPAIHGDYDPNADYAKVYETSSADLRPNAAPGTDPSHAYAATGAFNRFTGRWQNAELNPDSFNDEAKSRRQMNAFFDVDAAANSHGGQSLKAERSGKKLSKKEVRAFKDKRRDKKEEKRRAWLKD